jgi:hypothetical protein
MSSDEEDIDLNDDNASQLETATDDGTDAMELEGKITTTRAPYQRFYLFPFP